MISKNELQLVHTIFRAVSIFGISPFQFKHGQLIWTKSWGRLGFHGAQLFLNGVVLILLITSLKSSLVNGKSISLKFIGHCMCIVTLVLNLFLKLNMKIHHNEISALVYQLSKWNNLNGMKIKIFECMILNYID